MRIRSLFAFVIGLVVIATNPVSADTVTVDLEYRTDTLQWQLYAKVVDTVGGNNGTFGLAALRALIDNIDYGTNGSAVTIAGGIGAINPVAAGTPFERPAVVLTTGGTLDVVYGQDTSVPASVVGGVGVAARALIMSGSFPLASAPPVFGNDDIGLTTDGNFLNVAAPGPFGNSLPWSGSTLNVLNVTPGGGLGGDYNGNGKVDAADYTVWRNNLGGNAAAFASGSRKPSNSGPVNNDDYSFWKTNFGAPGGSGAIAASVPEPAMPIMIGLAIAALSFARGRKK